MIFFDADTKIPKKFLQNVKKTFVEQNPDILTTWLKTDSKLKTDKAIEIGMNSIFEISNFFGTPSTVGAFMAIRKNVFTKLKGFNEKMRFAEDTDLLERIVKSGHNYTISRDNYYYFSLRRFKKEGTLKSLRQYALLNLNRALKINKFTNLPDYEMGGHLFDKNHKNDSLTWLKKSLDIITKKKNKQKILKPKDVNFLKNLWLDLKTEWKNQGV